MHILIRQLSGCSGGKADERLEGKREKEKTWKPLRWEGGSLDDISWEIFILDEYLTIVMYVRHFLQLQYGLKLK